MFIRPRLEPTALTWRIHEHLGATTVELLGEIDENTDFADLHRQIGRPAALVLDLAEVRRINSCGVREWVSFIRDLADDRSHGAAIDITFVACSPVFVTQLNMIYNFRGPAKVRSFLAPYVCSECENEEEKLLDVATHFPGRGRPPPEFTCARCSSPMELDDLPERYLSFLNDS